VGPEHSALLDGSVGPFVSRRDGFQADLGVRPQVTLIAGTPETPAVHIYEATPSEGVTLRIEASKTASIPHERLRPALVDAAVSSMREAHLRVAESTVADVSVAGMPAVRVESVDDPSESNGKRRGRSIALFHEDTLFVLTGLADPDGPSRAALNAAFGRLAQTFELRPQPSLTR
jgi:hypothetical protein